jgi:asparagine synthase (glutamine-hydrolysing)
MCGIVGICGPGAKPQLAEQMLGQILHRGPDGVGLYTDRDTILAHSRLQVIDLETGDQPMVDAGGTTAVIYNGEIYNYRELTAELEALGCTFRTSSDTEVLIHGYQVWGLDLLAKLDGMFAFGLWDGKEQRLLLARDLFGIKPLHYQFDGSTLRFASEAKAILRDPAVPREIDFQALHWFLNLRYIPGERTLFSHISRLLPGHYLLFEKGEITSRRYDRLALADEPRRDESYYIEGTRHHLKEAVRKQMVSDVPIGVYLSGGLDSSSLVAMMREVTSDTIRTFSLGFNEPTDELEDARLIADHFATTHHEMSLDPEPLLLYPKVIWACEEPKENILQGYILASFARQHVKVVQGGLGGDELFAGYLNNRFLRPSDPFHRWVPGAVNSGLMAPLSRLAFRLQSGMGRLRWDEYRRGLQLLLSIGDPTLYYLILRNTWDQDPGAFNRHYGHAWDSLDPQPAYSLFRPFFDQCNGRALEGALWAELHTKMVDDFLLNEDRTSMAHGLEVRVPFLDRDLVQFSLSIPTDLKMRGQEMKYIFRRSMEGILPRHALEKKKWGFSFNPYHQFRKDLKPVAERILTKERVDQRGWFNYDFLRQILDHPAHPRLRWHYFYLWLALGLEIWCQMFIEGDLDSPETDLEAFYG